MRSMMRVEKQMKMTRKTLQCMVWKLELSCTVVRLITLHKGNLLL